MTTEASNLSALGKALDQTSISSAASPGGIAAALDSVPNDTDGAAGDEEEEDEDAYADDYGDDDDEANDLLMDFEANGNDDDDDDDDDDDEADDDDLVPLVPSGPPKKSPPKKRERTDSLKKMLPAPAAQRAKQFPDDANTTTSPGDSESNSEDWSTASGSQDNAQVKLMVKDRKGGGMGVPNAHSILTAVKQAPPAKEKSNPRRWSKHEDESLRLAVERSGERNWKAIADQVPGRNHTQCLQRWTKVLKPGLIKGHWTPEEDAKLRDLVAEGKKNWGQVASLIPGRTSKQCRERWCNHLDPNINKGSYTEDEDKIIIEMQAKLGNRWSIIAQQLKGRTEDAVKIRWKSLMRGRRAASKEDKSDLGDAHTTPIVSVDAQIADRSKPKSTKSTPTRQKSRTASPVMKAEAEPINPVPPMDDLSDLALQTASIAAISSVDFSSTNGNMANSSNPVDTSSNINTSVQNMNDLVAASIHNFRMSQRFHPSSGGAAPTRAMANPNTSKTMSPANHMIFPGYNVNVVQNPYVVPPGYPMQANMNQQYAVPVNFGVSPEMPMSMQVTSAGMQYQGIPDAMSQVASGMNPSMSIPQNQSFATQQMGSQYPPSSISVTQQQFPGSNSMMGADPSMTVTAPAPTNAWSNGLPPSSAAAAAAAAAGRPFDTPREEWGSSQTPRSHMIMTEGHASAYELFHQQRLRLMLKEREKQDPSLLSAPSPGQAMLTMELEANKERQKRQAIMHKGWKSAVDAMMAFNNDLVTLDDQQRFDGFLEKVTLSALDPTDDDLLGHSVDIIAGDEVIGIENPVE